MKNGQNNVYNRLHNEHSYTGMYAERVVRDNRVPNYAQDNSALFREGLHPGRSSLDAQTARRRSTHALTITGAQSTRELPLQSLQDPASRIEYLFKFYSGHGRSAQQSRSELSSCNFIKFVRDTPRLIGQNFKAADIDIVFAKSKRMQDRGLKMDSFLDALSTIASKKFPQHEPQKAFTYLLAQHVLHNKAITNAMKCRSPTQRYREFQQQAYRSAVSSSIEKDTFFNAQQPSIIGSKEDKKLTPGLAETENDVDLISHRLSLPEKVNFPKQVPPIAAYNHGSAQLCTLPKATNSFREAAVLDTADANVDTLAMGIITSETGDELETASGRLYAHASRLGCNSSVGVGFRVGNPDATVTVGAFVDLTCSKSSDLFFTLFTKVLVRMEQSRKGQVAVVIYPYLTPWRANSLIVNEVAIAVRQASPQAYLDFCIAVLKNQASFSEASLHGLSRQTVHGNLLELVKVSGGNVKAVQDSIQVRGADGNRLWRTVQLDALFAIQNGIRSCPTITINGLVDYFPTSSWSVVDWISYLTKLL